ncbi:polysaccharide deacetylase family protein [Micromonospora sagamiensis]|uniref:Peptidoglycan/xylan/chitin deacetylase (PgdA/CDA1 family) n=1 Tax=Micromonospora sagamiensis TaxID=47875 RepID=A0A562WC04_9ACTN|nr:polysaccharide deacetylase family protein [Micromonospora sagamiensis]TWJ27487.1 peptidoglycan/xylan/chitin deacetylase (PgdA/CDA1 family) [Micromonospora sagamiensis]BCL13627.1 lipoprotein [Micromonospora sagamiensis]
MFLKKIHVLLLATTLVVVSGVAALAWSGDQRLTDGGAWVTRAPATPGATGSDPAEQPAPGVSGRLGGTPGTPGRIPGATRPGTRPPVVDHGPRTGDKVALTFDADMTDAMLYQLRTGRVRSYANLRIIEMLEREKVPATFFLTGKWVERYPDITRRLAGNPRFELANHSYGHLAFTSDCYNLPRIPAGQMTSDVARTFELVEAYGGRQTRYFRFPGLCHDGAALAALAPLGTTVVDGDVVSGDPFATAWRPIVRAVLSQVKPGSVIVLHVTEANAAMTDEALPHILAGLAERGLTPAPLSEVLGDGALAADPTQER